MIEELGYENVKVVSGGGWEMEKVFDYFDKGKVNNPMKSRKAGGGSK
jgi:hypothetical protein